MSVPANIYRYRLISTNSNSQKYGNCEICRKPATEVFHQTEERLYLHPLGVDHQDPDAPTGYGWTRHQCSDVFGHKECLEHKQRGVRLPLSLEAFKKRFCTGKEYDSCVNSRCQYSGQVCQHPLHPCNHKGNFSVMK